MISQVDLVKLTDGYGLSDRYEIVCIMSSLPGR